MPPETRVENQNAEIPVVSVLSRHAHWAVRLGLASIFLFHGIGKFPTAAAMADMMGMPVAMVYMLGSMEVGAALLLLAGGFGRDILTRIGALILVPVMLGAIALVHWPQWSFVASESHPMGGMEFQVFVLLVSLYLVIKGNAIGESA